MERFTKILPRISLQAAFLLGAAILMGIIFNSVNPNGIPLSPKKRAGVLPQQSSPSTISQTTSPKPELKNETKAVTLIRGSSDKEDEPEK